MSKPRKKPSLPRRILSQVVLIALSFLYIMLVAMLLMFGYIVGWDLDPGRPVVGVLMLIGAVAVFILGPRVIKRLTGREPLVPPYGTV